MKGIKKIWILPLVIILLMIGFFAFAQEDLDAEGIIRIFERLAQFAITVALSLMVIYIVISGIKMATAGGDIAKFQDAKKSLLWGLIGSLVVLGVYVIINTIKNLVTGNI